MRKVGTSAEMWREYRAYENVRATHRLVEVGVLPKSKPHYVVISPTPLPQKSVPPAPAATPLPPDDPPRGSHKGKAP